MGDAVRLQYVTHRECAYLGKCIVPGKIADDVAVSGHHPLLLIGVGLLRDRVEASLGIGADIGFAAVRLAAYATPAMSIFDEPKIDCHVHVLDPLRFPYDEHTHYRPAGQEMASAAQLAQAMNAYGVQYALVVGPNSGYGLDNRCLHDTLARGHGRLKGVAVVGNDATVGELEALKAAGVVGVAWNVTHYGVAHYANAASLLDRLASLGMYIDIQVEHDQLVPLAPMLVDSGVRTLVDHCGRPTAAEGTGQAGFEALLGLAATRRAFVKLSGIAKVTREAWPHADAQPYVDALVDAYTLDACMWASDWPYLRASGHIDYGVLLKLVEHQFPDAADRHKLLWETPDRLFGFSGRCA